MEMVTTQQELLQKIAKMELQEVAATDIASVFSLSPEKISEITASDEYKAIKAELFLEKSEEAETRTNAWDRLEDLSLGHLIEHMEIKPDPEFALKVAAVANKAQRRTMRNEPIAGQVAGRTVLQMNLTFVEKMNTAFQIKPREERLQQNSSRDVNMMSIREVQETFRDKKDPALEELEEQFKDVN